METEQYTYGKILKKLALENPDGIALNFNGQDISFKKFNSVTDQFANYLIEKGLCPGDKVAVWGYNSANWLMSFVSIIKAGGVAVFMNYSLPSSEFSSLIKMVEVKFIVYGKNRELKNNENALVEISQATGVEEEAFIPMDKIIHEFEESLDKDIIPMFDLEKEDPKRTAVIIFTTGTTSVPKPVQLSQFGVIKNSFDYVNVNQEYCGKKVCVAAPLFHIYGLTISTFYWCTGRTVYLIEKIKIETIKDIIYKYSISDMASVGTIYFNLIEENDFDIKVMPNINLCFIAAGFSTPVQIMRLESAFRHAKFVNAYGQTETSPALTVINADDCLEKRLHTVGKVLPDMEVRIWDKERGFLGTNESGEIVTKGYQVMNGYFGLPYEMQPFDENGWLHTGDLGYFDDESYLHLSGRIKDIIIKSGENISPVDVEKEISRFDGIKEVKVLGAPHNITGESVEACIVLADKKPFDEEKIRVFLKENIAPFKIPEHFFIFDKFPVNANNKLDVRSLKDEMVKRLRTVKISKALQRGFEISTVSFKSSPLFIDSAISMLEKFIPVLKYSENRTKQICKTIRAILQERILNAYTPVGEIQLSLKLMSGFLRIEMFDEGDKYFIENNNNSNESAKIILEYVNKFSTLKNRNEQTVYCFDFNYDEDFDIMDFLQSNSRTI